MQEEVKILDKGFVRLDAALANDLRVVNSAKVSFGKRSSSIGDREIGIINSLMRDKHGTPFEHNYMCFHVKAPLVVFREWHRHRVGISINEYSGRYSEMIEDYYIPALPDVRKQVGKPMEYKFEKIDDELAENFIKRLDEFCVKAYEMYKTAIENGIAKELARLFLPVNWYSEMYWSCNARSLMHFLNLRNAPPAMHEIKCYAEVLEDFFSQLMPITHKAFIDNGRIAP